MDGWMARDLGTYIHLHLHLHIQIQIQIHIHIHNKYKRTCKDYRCIESLANGYGQTGRPIDGQGYEKEGQMDTDANIFVRIPPTPPPPNPTPTPPSPKP